MVCRRRGWCGIARTSDTPRFRVRVAVPGHVRSILVALLETDMELPQLSGGLYMVTQH